MVQIEQESEDDLLLNPWKIKLTAEVQHALNPHCVLLKRLLVEAHKLIPTEVPVLSYKPSTFLAGERSTMITGGLLDTDLAVINSQFAVHYRSGSPVHCSYCLGGNLCCGTMTHGSNFQ